MCVLHRVQRDRVKMRDDGGFSLSGGNRKCHMQNYNH